MENYSEDDFIFVDTETTGLLKPNANKLDEQPHMTEFYGIRLNKDFEFITELDTLINPGVEIPEFIVKKIKITDEMVANKPSFATLYPDICDLFMGCRNVVAHNAAFDMGMIYVELARMEKEFHFPWPVNWICTVEKSMGIKNKRLKLTDLHEIMTGEPHKNNAHRAKADVHALVRAFIQMKNRGMV